MFHQSPKRPAKPSYFNPDAREGTKGQGAGEFEPWAFGKEIDLYNSRNIYTRGGSWRWAAGRGELDWVEDGGDQYLELSSDLVPKVEHPRLLWTGWTRGWREKGGAVRPEQLCIHRDDAFPKPHSRVGKGIYRTRKTREAWEVWSKYGGTGVRWVGDGYLEVGYGRELDDDALASIGWKRTLGGALLDIDTGAPGWITKSGVLLPGHDPLKWGGVSKVEIKSSWAEGCLPSSLIVNDPNAAGRVLLGCANIPSGCELKVDDRYSLGLFSGRCVPWVEGKIAVPARRMVPLLPRVRSVSLHIPRSGKATYLISPDDIDFSKISRPSIGTYFGKGGEEKCLITPRVDAMRAAGVVTRTKVVENPGIFYRVIAPFPNGRKTSSQKMAGVARVERLPSQNKGEQSRLESLYGDVVGEDYYRRDEEFYKLAAAERDSAMREGFFDISTARGRSAVPGDVFDRLVARGAVRSRKISTGKKYFKPVSFGDISQEPRLVSEITRIAREDELGWLCQIVAMSPREFTRELVSGALESH